MAMLIITYQYQASIFVRVCAWPFDYGVFVAIAMIMILSNWHLWEEKRKIMLHL